MSENKEEVIEEEELSNHTAIEFQNIKNVEKEDLDLEKSCTPNTQAGDNVQNTEVVKDTEVTEEVMEDDNAFAYLDRQDFTSEKYKIIIRNMPKYFSMAELKKLFKKQNLSANKFKRPSGKNSGNIVYVCFRSDEARDEGIKTINGFKWKGNELLADVASAVPDPLVVKRKARNTNEVGLEKKPKYEDVVTMLKYSATPLWDQSYEDQLKLKTDKIKNLLRKLSSDLVYNNRDLKQWVGEQLKKFDGLPCEMLDIRGSPIVNGYRNKCEFTIGINAATGEKTIGMRVSSYAEGSVNVAPTNDLPHVPYIMNKARDIAEMFVRESALDVFDPETHEGYWKLLTIRYGFRTNQLMLLFVLNPQDLTAENLADVRKNLGEFFSSAKAGGLTVHSLLLGTAGRGQDVSDFTLVSGLPYIYDEICGFRFRISPTSFFQVNTEAADVLYNSIASLSGVTEKSTLVDVCCGAGTIGICLSKFVGEVLGLEKFPEAVTDAKQNAADNKVTNTEFFEGTAEDLLAAVIRRAKHSHVVAVVDPPRAGLGKTAVAHLRKTKQLEEVVYVSCNAALAYKNFVDLGRSASKQYPGDPYVPVKCVIVDLFPHTEGCELVILFNRFSKVLREAGKVDTAS